MNKDNLISKSKLQALQQWFIENPKLPQEIDSTLLRRFLKCTHGNVENAKKLLELNFSIRNKHPHIFMDKRDIDDDHLKKVVETHDVIILPGLTPQRHKLVLSRLADYDASKLDSLREAKFLVMLSDCRLTMTNDEEDTIDVDDDQVYYDADGDDDDDDDDNITDFLADGEVQIIDMAGSTMSHIASISISVLRINSHYMQKAYPVRLCAIHVINCPSIFNKMMAFIKPFVHQELFNMIHLHSEGLDTLYEHVPRDMLPDEYGGKAGKVVDIKMKWIRIVKEKRNYLMDSKKWQIQKDSGNSKRSFLWW